MTVQRLAVIPTTQLSSCLRPLSFHTATPTPFMSVLPFILCLVVSRDIFADLLGLCASIFYVSCMYQSVFSA